MKKIIDIVGSVVRKFITRSAVTLTKVEAEEIVEVYAKKYGIRDWKFVGGLASKGKTEHDIDVWISIWVDKDTALDFANDIHEESGRRMRVFVPKVKHEIEKPGAPDVWVYSAGGTFGQQVDEIHRSDIEAYVRRH